MVEFICTSSTKLLPYFISVVTQQLMPNKYKLAQCRFRKSLTQACRKFKDVLGRQPYQETCRPAFAEERAGHEICTEVPELQQILEDGGQGGGGAVVVAGGVQPDGQGLQQEEQAGRGLSSA